MSGRHLQLFCALLLVHCAASLKLLTLVQPYLIQAPSTTLIQKEEPPAEDLPVYRDLPPIKRTSQQDLSEALEATRNLKYTRPPLDAQAFFASLKKAAEEVHAVVVGIAPPIPDIQMLKPDVMDLAEKTEGKKDEALSKSSNEALSFSPKAAALNLPVKRSEGSYVKYMGAEDFPLLKAESNLDVRVQAPFTDVQVRKEAVEEGDGTEVPILDTESPVPPTPGIDVGGQGGYGYGYGSGSQFGVRVEAPFTNVKVLKGEGGGQVGVKVEAPFTNVRVLKDSGYGGGAQVGVNVEAPFTNVKVRKTAADVPPDALPPGYSPDMGVRVEAPFVKVKVDGPAAHTPLDGGIILPKRSGRPLNLDINIPGIFNLKLLRDEAGRGRLGIGVLPAFSSFINQYKAADSYPGPPSR